MLIGIVLSLGCQLNGSFVMLNYAAEIFALAGIALSANVAAIWVGVVLLLGTYASTVLVERTGRKVSTGATLVCATV